MRLATAAALAPAGALRAATGDIAAESPHPVLEMRQYKIVHGKRDPFIALFEREFVETQEALGYRLVGMFRDLDDPDRFVWLREFPSMAQRAQALSSFYFGPVWAAHRAEANPLLDDNDNVLLLRPAATALDFGNLERDGRRAGLVIATVHYLWKDPAEGFASFFEDTLVPSLRSAGLPVLGAFTPEKEPNNFPRLPVRQGEKVLVWFTRVADEVHYRSAMKAQRGTAAWRGAIAGRLADFEERDAQVLRLEPTSRSRLR